MYGNSSIKKLTKYRTYWETNLWQNVRFSMFYKCQSQWPRGLRPRSAAARLLRLLVRIPPRAWMFVCCERCVLSGRGLCDELITRPEESCQLWCVAVWSRNLKNKGPWPGLGSQRHKKKLTGHKNFPLICSHSAR